MEGHSMTVEGMIIFLSFVIEFAVRSFTSAENIPALYPIKPLIFFPEFMLFQLTLGKNLLTLFLGQNCKLPFLGDFGGAICYVY
jgi:hypothetical protein